MLFKSNAPTRSIFMVLTRPTRSLGRAYAIPTGHDQV
jgi:hypothetical protein